MEVVCIACEHGPHKKNPCVVCGCTNWQNSTVVQARVLVNINNLLMAELPNLTNAFTEIMLIAREAFPEAAAKVQEELDAEVKAMQELALAKQKEKDGIDGTKESPATSN